MRIHNLAVVHQNAQIGEDVNIGPFAVIGPDVVIGKGGKIGAHVVIDGWTQIGEYCEFYTGAVIGSPPQDLKYKGEKTRLVIGNYNIFREYITVNCGTAGGGGVTTLGDHCLMMAYSHVAHDCHLGNHVILANGVALSGHITIEDYAIIGGLAAVHQFVHIGAHCIVGGCSGVSQDPPPYMMVSGDKARVYGLNSVGLKRRNFSDDSIKVLQKAHRILFRSRLSMKHALEKVKAEVQRCPEIDHLIEFIERSERGICRGIMREREA
jgi:UDP-N-acetylglucosamine acyltransferase